MGATGYFCVFDEDRLRREIAPAFQEGEAHPLIAAEIAEMKAPHRFVGLWRVGFTEDLTSCDLSRDQHVVDGEIGPRRKGGWSYWDLASLFERVVTRHCILEGTIIGRSYRAVFHFEDPPPIIELLDQRARYWTHGSGGFSEGIHGWLDAAETHGLRELSLEDQVFAERFFGVVERARERGLGVLWGADLLYLRSLSR